MRPYVGAALCALAFATPALALDQGFPLRDALAHLPRVLLEQTVAQPAYFVDVSAALQTAPAQATPAELVRRMQVGGGLRAVQALASGGATVWQQAAGIAPSDLHYLVAFGKPAARTTVWGLGSAASVAQLMHALPAKGFSPYAANGLREGLANGEPMVLDLSRREPDNPWLGARGQTSIVAPLDTGVVQAGTPQAASLVQQARLTDSLAAHPALSPALGVLQQVAQEDGTRVIQALVLRPSDLALEPDTPAERATQARLRGAPNPPAEPAGERVPPYEAGIVADLQGSRAPEVGVALSYRDCVAATAAGEVLARAWQAGNPAGSAREPQGRPRADATVTVSITTREEQDGCAVLARLTEAGGERSANPVFDAVATAIDNDDLRILRLAPTAP
ncbi:hypothetical protein GCM10025795_16280 [Verticiella sediminum]